MAASGKTGVDAQTGFTLLHEGGGLSACPCSVLVKRRPGWCGDPGKPARRAPTDFLV